MDSRTIVGIGGFPNAVMLDYVFALAPGRRVLVDTTAGAQFDGDWLADWNADVTRLTFYPWPPANLRDLALAHDAIFVCGGNTANMLAVWRVHGFDRILREAWEAGVVLSGVSAGMICWFEAGVTDSFGPQLEGMRDGLGFLAGSACPHYDGEERRRPRYRELVDGGFPAGIAADDGVGVHFVGTELHEVVTCRPGAAAFRVTGEGEERLEARLIPSQHGVG
jgi:peptidase E